MNFKKFAVPAFMLISTLIACAAQAATIIPDGNVTINMGNGFMKVEGPIEVKPGDMVMVNTGTAQIKYASGQVALLEPGQVYTVGNEITVGSTGGEGAGAGGGGGGGGAGGGLGGGALAGGAGGLSTTALIVGGVAIAGGLGAAIYAASDGKSP